MKFLHQLVRIVALLSAGLALALAQTTASASTIVNAKLWDNGGAMGITVEQPSVPAGTITFNVQNDSNSYLHEMLVVKVNDYHDGMPYDMHKVGLVEDKIEALGEVAELTPGKSGQVTLDLQPGKYLLLCNQPGHFEEGMFTRLIITPNLISKQ